ncbi:MAG: sensor histidine kinase [Luteimonas sp.]
MMNWLARRLPSLALGVLCFVGVAQPANALDPAKALTQYVHTVWRTDDGLPQNSVTRILETDDGFLWVGTQAGVARFDGVSFTTFDHNNTPALSDDYITDLVQDRRGTLWIATFNNGVATFRDGTFSHFDAVDTRSGSTLAADMDGSVWIGGEHGLKHIRNGVVVKAYTTTDGLNADRIRRIVVDKEKSVWIGTLAGLNRLKDGKIQSFSTSDGLPNNEVVNLFLTADGTFLVKTRNSEIVRWNQDRFEPWLIPDVAGRAVRDALLDRNGNYWVASGTEGLIRFREQKLARFTTQHGLSSNEVACLYEDRDGNLWVGTTSGGLERFKDGSFTTYAKEEGLSSDQANSVFEDRAGSIWVTTSEGLNQLQGSKIRTTRADDKRHDTWSLWEDHASNLLVGTSSNAVLRLKNGHLVRFLSKRDGIPDYHISAIIEDRLQQLWLATRGGGLARYANGKTTLYSKATGLQGNSLFALAEGPDGTIWIGSDNGLNSLKGSDIASYPEVKNLAGAFVIALYFDSKGILWVGTFGRGLFRMENGRFTHYTARQGLSYDTVNSIAEDRAGNLWLGSDHDIVRIMRSDLDEVAAGTRPALTPVAFGKADGIKSAETNGGTQPSVWRAQDGRIWFPTNRGVVVVDPARVSLNDRPSAARIEGMVANEIPISINTAVRLAPETRRIDIGYTAPNLSSPQRSEFRYRLDGFDSEWVIGGKQRIAHYTNLYPGHYTFRVSTRIGSGTWSSHEATIGFELKPHFYQTWWFRLLCVLAGVTVAWGAYRLRVGWLHARAAVMEERQRIGSEIHDSLAQGLSGIIFQTEAALLSMPPGIASTRVISARDLAKASLDDARYSVWELSPPVLDQKSLAESIPSMARQLAHGRVDDLEINFSGNRWTTRPEANHHIVMIVQEAISNAIQHGHARTIVIKVAYETKALYLSVADDGLGFSPDPVVTEHARGYGMRNMRHRAARLGATLGILSEVGKGTQISLRIPKADRFRKIWHLLLGRNIPRIDG